MDRTHFFISNSELKEARRLLGKILLFAPILLLVAAVNLYCDPAGLYKRITNNGGNYEYHAAQAMANGKKGILASYMDQRLLEKYFIESLNVAPDIVVLGSSRMMWVGANIFPGRNVINNSVPRAELADCLGIFDMYARKNLYPQRVILSFDPQLISLPVQSEQWLSIKEDTQDMLKRLNIRTEKIKEPLIPQAWANIFSFSYFQRSMQVLMHLFFQGPHPVNKIMNGVLLFNDGRWLPYTDPSFMRNNPFAEELSYNMKPDKELEGILEAFMQYLKRHHVQVTLCLLPLQPQKYQSLIGPRKNPEALDVIGIEKYYRGLAQRLGLGIVGSYDPSVCNLNNSDFYDAEHVRQEVLERILKQKGTACSMSDL